jgi:hypothetical protein
MIKFSSLGFHTTVSAKTVVAAMSEAPTTIAVGLLTTKPGTVTPRIVAAINAMTMGICLRRAFESLPVANMRATLGIFT